MDPKELAAKALADKLKESADAAKAAEVATKEGTEVLKSVAASLEKLVEISAKPVEKVAESEAVLELKADIAFIKAKASAENQGNSDLGGKKMEAKSLNAIKIFKSATISKASASFDEESSIYNKCGVLEQKSLRTFDNSDAGAFVPVTRILGTININLQTVNPVTSIVNNVSAGAMVAGDLGYSTYDDSAVDISESNEGVGATETDLSKNGLINIHLAKNSAKVKITDKTLMAAESGELSTNPITKTFMAIERKYEKNLARKILNGVLGMGVNGIFYKAQKSGFRGSVIPTSTGNKVVLADLSVLASRLKGDYLRNAAILIDRAALYELYLEEAADGHLKIEQFDYANGIASLRTAERVIPLIGVDSSYLVSKIAQNDGFANYTPFSGAVSASSLAGYTPSALSSASGATDNEGKVVAVLADFSEAYSLARSSAVKVGYDQSFGNLINDGYVWGGKIGFVGGDVTNEEAIALLYVK